MFDAVGRRRGLRKQREAGSVLASLLVNGALLGAILYAGTNVADQILDEDEPVEVTYFDEAPPPPPPPPPPPASSTPKTKKEKPKEPEPEPEMVEPEIVEELPEELPEDPG